MATRKEKKERQTNFHKTIHRILNNTDTVKIRSKFMCSTRIRSFSRSRITTFKWRCGYYSEFLKADYFILKRFINILFFYHDNGSCIMTTG